MTTKPRTKKSTVAKTTKVPAAPTPTVPYPTTITKDVNPVYLKQIALQRLADLATPKPEEEAKPGPLAKLSPELRERCRRLVGILPKHFGEGHCNALSHVLPYVMDVPEEAFAGLRVTTAAYGDEITPKEWLAGTPVVLLSNPNYHNYKNGRVLFYLGNGSVACYISDINEVRTGNNMPKGRKHWRLATAEEVIAAITPQSITQFQKNAEEKKKYLIERKAQLDAELAALG